MAGFVLAGGRSARMKEDKALVELAGRPLIAHALDVLRGAGLEPRIAGARTDLGRFAPVLADADPDRGPLGGVVSALAQVAYEWAAFVSVDMPLMAPELVAYLLADALRSERAVTLASMNGFAQTFPAVIRRDALPLLAERLDAGSSGCFRAFQATGERGMRILEAEALVQAGQVSDPRGLWPFQWFLNVNLPEDLERVSAAFPGRIA